MTGVVAFVSYSWAIEDDEVSIDSYRLLCIGTLSPSSSPPRSRCIFAPRAHVIWIHTRASPPRSRPPPLLCVNCIIFTPNTFRPHAPRHGLRGQQVKLHMSIVSHPPATVSQCTPPVCRPSSLPSTWVFPFFQKSRIFALSPARSSRFENHAKSWSWRLSFFFCYDAIS